MSESTNQTCLRYEIDKPGFLNVEELLLPCLVEILYTGTWYGLSMLKLIIMLKYAKCIDETSEVFSLRLIILDFLTPSY